MTWVQTASRRAFDLRDPRAEDVDFVVDIPDALARTARFGGHVAAGPYSVAQHCVLGAQCIEQETGDADLARRFLLHDAHEAYIGDITTPVVEAIGAGEAVRALKRAIDAAIFDAARLPRVEAAFHEQIRHWDLRMLAAEVAQLMGAPPRPWASLRGVTPAPLYGRIKVWPWTMASDNWKRAFARLFPHIV